MEKTDVIDVEVGVVEKDDIEPELYVDEMAVEFMLCEASYRAHTSLVVFFTSV